MNDFESFENELIMSSERDVIETGCHRCVDCNECPEQNLCGESLD